MRSARTANSGLKIGTTKRGIGPAYEDKVGRRAIRLVDLAEPDTLMPKIERLLAHHNALRRGMGLTEIEPQAIYDELMEVARPHPAVRRPGLAAARREAARRRAHPVRGRAGRAARQRPRHLSVRHLVQHGRRTGGGGVGAGADGDRLCARDHQGLHDPGGRGAVPDASFRRDRRHFLGERGKEVGVNHRPASAAAAGSTRCWCARPSGPRGSPASR